MMTGRFVRDCRMKGSDKGKGKDGGKGHANGKRKTVKGKGKKGSGTLGSPKGGLLGESKGWGCQGQNWRCGRTADRAAECRWRVAGIEEEDGDCPRSGGQPESEEGCGSLGMWWNSRKRNKAPATRGADPCTGHLKIKLMSHVKIVKISATG